MKRGERSCLSYDAEPGTNSCFQCFVISEDWKVTSCCLGLVLLPRIIPVAQALRCLAMLSLHNSVKFFSWDDSSMLSSQETPFTVAPLSEYGIPAGISPPAEEFLNRSVSRYRPVGRQTPRHGGKISEFAVIFITSDVIRP